MLNFAKSKKIMTTLSMERTKPKPDSRQSVDTEAVTPVAAREMVASTCPENPWSTINDMLIQNRCWLCRETFLRGKMKKVFMLSHLLAYVEERYKLEKMVAQDPKTPTCRLLNTDVATVLNKAAQDNHAQRFLITQMRTTNDSDVATTCSTASGRPYIKYAKNLEE